MTFLAMDRLRIDAMRRRQLLLSVSLLAGSSAKYGREAYAQPICLPAGGTHYLCEGTSSDTQSIISDNANVEAGNSVVIETDPVKGGNGGNAISISGGGDIRFVSSPGSYVVLSGETNGLSIISTGDIGTTPGSVFVETSGYFVGRYGINAVNYGNGAATIHFDGTAIGTNVGLSARSVASAGGLFITAGKNAYITGDTSGLSAINTGSGPTVVKVDGYVGSAGQAIAVINTPLGSDMSITTGADSEVLGLTGIFARHVGSGTARIDVGGKVTGTGQYGVLLRGQNNAGDLVITTAAGSVVTGARGISLDNRGRGDSLVVVSGDVLSNHTFDSTVVVSNGANAGDATVITQAGSNIEGRSSGIIVSNGGTGVSTVAVNGNVSAYLEHGIYVHNSGSAAGIAVTVGRSGRVAGNKYGINAQNDAGGETEILVNGDVIGTTDSGVRAFNGAGASNLIVTAGAQSTISGRLAGISAFNTGTGGTTVALAGHITSTYGVAVNVGNGVTATDLTVSTAAGSTIEGVSGISAVNTGTGATTVTIGGDVLGSGDDGIFLSGGQGSRLSILRGATVTSQGTTTDDDAIEIGGQANVTVAGSVMGGGGYAIRFDTANVFDDRLELQPGWEVKGKVDAGLGFDTLAFGGSAAGTGSADMAFDMTRVDIGGTGVPGADFLGFDAFAKTGTSVLELTGSNNGVADFAVDQGTVALNARLPGMTFAVGSGATLAGDGTAGSFVFGSGATAAPGKAGEIGLLTSQGSADFGAGSRFLVDVAANGKSDRIAAGSAAVDGGTVVVNAVPSSGVFVDGQRFVILDAAGGLQGGFDRIEKRFDSIFLDFAFANTPTQVAIETDVTSFDSAAATANQAAVARSLFAFGGSSDPDAQSVYNSILFARTAEEAQADFDAASGEIYADLQTALANSSIGFGRVLRMHAGLPPTVTPAGEPLAYASTPLAVRGTGAPFPPAASGAAHGLWGQMIAGSASIDGDGAAADLDLTLGGVAAGAEILESDSGFSAGLAFGYVHTRASQLSSDAEVDSGHVGVYAAMESGPLLLTAATHFGLHNLETSRDAVIGGVGGTATASYGAQSLGVSAAARYRLEVGNLTVSPFTGVDAAYVHSNGATESGAGVLNLTIDPADYAAGTLAAGLALGQQWQLDGEARLSAEVGAAYERGFGGAPDQSLAFVVGPGYTISGVDLDGNRLALEARLDLSFDRGLTFSGGYRGSFGADSTTQTGEFSIGYKF
ncbi:autotransporter domain-containing protein [Mesorhizobium sp. BAC0120]|uniref:autotransporter domain-containing protein n=1 Tax=Mesorhizobium sp. BAC0120 TaxID=3090670 RepID=UPI00298CAD91|nr:autotransporter domain-containing protein [Mesorhizobium sp. BAC0120]MDW6025621.1 autotransporter domain-containing protein [Mesorhizobium sp. BAC0120]